jgi:hypothetical protein
MTKKNDLRYGRSDAGERVQEARAETQARKHYEVEVNKGSLNVSGFERQMNGRWDSGWRLSHIFEQSGNTVVVWERRADRVAEQ